jgi:predicted enzyme related to lactoylglutathione lyase
MKIALIQLQAKNVERLASFYVKAFDLEIVHKEEGFAPLSGGGCFLSIHQSGKSGGEMTSITFSPEDVHSAKEDLAKKGSKLGEVYEVEGFAFAKGRDPEGNCIHLSSWAFSSAVPKS